MANYITTQEMKDYISNYAYETMSFGSVVSRIDLDRVEDTDFLFEYENITFEPTFEGKNTFIVKFDSPTTYKVYHTKTELFRDRFRGIGDINLDFVITGEMTITAGVFGGVINTGDIVEFSADGFISDSKLDQVILDAENEIDSYAKTFKVLLYDMRYDHIPLFIQNLPLIDNYDYTQGPMPIFNEVKLATKKWTLAFLLERKLLPSTSGASLVEGWNKTLKNSARKGIAQFIKRYETHGFSVKRLNPEELDKTICEKSLSNLFSREYCTKCKQEVCCCGV